MSATPEMVERVARALCAEPGTDPDVICETHHPDGPRPAWMSYVPTAIIAITAMREPTAAMADAGRWPGEDGEPIEAWQAMIDVSLSPSTVEAGR